MKLSVIGYHGTNLPIDKFRGVVYFTNSRSGAMAYARGKARTKKEGGPIVYKVLLDFKNAYQFQTMQQIGTLTVKDIEEFKKEGYDGGFYDGKTGKENIPEYVPFYPERLRKLS